MPQSKGTATWLTNVKQDAPIERVRLDNSRARIENKRIDHEHGQQVETIWMQYHRNKADMKYELKRAREEAERWRRMRAQLERNRVRSAPDSRRKERQLLKQQAEEANYAIIGPDGKVLHSNKTNENLTVGRKSLGNKMSSTTGMSRNSTSGLKTGSSQSPQNGKRPITVDHPGRTNSDTDSDANDSDDDDDDGDSNDTDDNDDDDVFNPNFRRTVKILPPPSTVISSSKLVSSGKGKQGRSKSTSAAAGHLRSRTSFSRSSVSSEVDGFEHSSGKPGRSFQELKDLTHIDRIADNMKVNKRAEMLKMREMHQAQEHARLQKRIESFYVDVETLKRKLIPAPKETNKLKPLRITSWN